MKPTYAAPVLETLSLKATEDLGLGIGITIGLPGLPGIGS